jgi:hypothetical protein
MARISLACRGRKLARVVSPAAFLAIAAVADGASAEAPQNLKWWNDNDVVAPSIDSAAATNAGRASVHDAPGEGISQPSRQLPPSNLEWWESERAESELNWWKAKRDSQSLRWWSQDKPAVRQVGAQQTPFGRKPQEPMLPEAAQDAAPMPQPPLDGRTPGAANVDFDPFSVVPHLKPMSDIAVTLAPSPPVPIDVETAQPAYIGTAEEYFASQGSAMLAPRMWPQRTPEAAAYQFYSRPLWYEDANVERCGQTVGCLQPAVSGTYFLANSFLLPYRFAAEPQCATVPQKQFCPPGCRYTHAQNYLPPWSPAGALAEGAAATGLIFLIP